MAARRPVSSYPRVYAMLKRAGHDPAKAAEIVLDACRGDAHALRWILVVFQSRH